MTTDNAIPPPGHSHTHPHANPARPTHQPGPPPRILVYTAVTGDSATRLRDSLRAISPVAADPHCDFVCFTNLPPHAWNPPAGWASRVVSLDRVRDHTCCPSQRPRLLARAIKILIHEFMDITPYDTVVWVDGNVNFLTPPSAMVEALAPRRDRAGALPFMASFCHHERQSVTKEITFVLLHRPEELTNLPALEDVFRKEGFADESGLYETCVVVREVCDATKKFCRQWFDLMVRVGLRDQVVLPFVVSRCRESVRFLGAAYKWRHDPKADSHLKWPKAPWVERRAHNRLGT